MTLDKKFIEAIRKTQTGLEKVVLYFDPNCPKTDQAVKDLYLAAMFLDKTMDRILDDQSFTEQDATCVTRESLKNLRGTRL